MENIQLKLQVLVLILYNWKFFWRDNALLGAGDNSFCGEDDVM